MDALRRLPALLARQRRRRSLAQAARWSVFLVVAHLLFLAMAGVSSVRQPLSEAWLQAIAWSYAIYLLLPVLLLVAWKIRSNTPEAVARELDHANPDAPDPFRTILSLGSHPESTRRELDRLLADHLPRLVFPRSASFPLLQRLLLLASVLAFAGAALVSGNFADFLYRAAAPWHALASLPILRFAVEAPPSAIGVGDTVRIRGTVVHRLPDQAIHAHVRTAAGESRYPLKLDGDRFDFAFGPVEGDFSVQFAAANGRSPAYRVRVLSLPFLASLRAVVHPPDYTRLRADTVPPGVTNFPVLPGSRVRWMAKADRDLRSVRWETRDSLRTQADTLGPAEVYIVDREVRRPLEYTYVLEDAQGIRSREKQSGLVDLLPDHPPELELLDPAEDRALDREARLPLAFRAKDDFGLTSLKLAWRILSDGAVKAEGRRDAKDWLAHAASGLVETVWDMQGLELRPENVLEIHLEATDNDTVNGPKTARSAIRSLRMPSIQEVLEAGRRQEQSAMANLKSAIERERQLERKLEREAGPPRDEGPPALAGYEIDRIMVDSPREQAMRAEAALTLAEQILARREKESGEGTRGARDDKARKDPLARKADTQVRAAVREAKDVLRESREAIPRRNQSQLPLEERRKNLDALMKAQKEQEKSLTALMEKLAKTPAREELPRSQVDFAAKELKRNLESQTDLKRLFEEEAYQQRAKSERMEQGAQEQMRLAEDMKKAVDDIEKTLEQSRKNGLLSPDLLDKMEKIQELLKEVLPDSLQRLMEQKMAGQEVDAREMRDQLQKLLGKQGELGENLNRALAMLEQLKDKKRMQELKAALEDLEARERDLARSLAGGEGRDSDLEARQKAIQSEFKKAMDDFAAHAQDRKALEDAARGLKPGEAQKDMQEVRDALAPRNASRSRAAGSARDAADKLVAMQSSLGASMAGMENTVDISEAHALLQESLALSRLQLLIRAGAARRAAEGWDADEPALHATVAQTAQWLSDRVKVFSATIPFMGGAMAAEARNMSAAAREAAGEFSHGAAEKALHHNQNLARELLKLLKMAQSQGGGGGQGGGGSLAQGGGQEGGGQGQGGQGGAGDLSGQLKGMSGKQMAINQATQQLLRAMMEGRRPGSQGTGTSGQGGGGESGGQEGAGGESGGQGRMPGQRGEGRIGPGSPGGEGGGREGSMQGLGNRQGELGESLESLAEELAEEGDGARKVRRLAEEARRLEEDMRQGRVTPEDLRRRQERFQSRMLEAANALEERGMSEERKAETGKGPGKGPVESARAAEGRLLQLLREARRNSRQLPLSEAQRRALDEYYESLLTR